MDFQISGLPLAPFVPLFGLPEPVLAAQGVRRCIADHDPGYPCRVSLRDAAVGESVLLLNFEHLPVAGPYRSRHAIYVREAAREARLAANEVPEVLRIRLLSVRAFDAVGSMVEADVVDGQRLEEVIGRCLDSPRVAYLHVHNAKPGCFAARVDRVPQSPPG